MAIDNKCPECGEIISADAPMGVCPKCLIDIGLDRPSPLRTTEGSHPEPATRLPSVEELQSLLPEFEFIEIVGYGGMGAVYRARQRSLERDVAIKILPGKLEKDPTFAERFLREAKALAQLSHPNIVTVFDFGQVESLNYFAMEFIDGVNLRQAIRSGNLEPQQALGVVRQICDALQYAHDQGVVHRDIKPENVLLDQHGRAKIADFGLAKILSSGKDVTLTRTQQVVGTVHYMAPEQVEKPETVDHRADIYSLGVVFYELLTGELPIGRFAAPSEKVPVNEGIDQVVLRSLEKEPNRRFQQAVDVKTAVEESIVAPVATKPEQAAAPVKPPRKDVGLSVPITTAEHAIIFRGYGILRMEGLGLVIEYQLIDSVLGFNLSTVHRKEVALDDIREIRLHKGFVNHSIEIQSQSLSVFDHVPGNRQGRVTLKVASNDLHAAERLVEQVRQDVGLGAQRSYSSTLYTSTESKTGGPDDPLVPEDVVRLRGRLLWYSWALFAAAILDLGMLGIFFVRATDDVEYVLRFGVLIFPIFSMIQLFAFFLTRHVKSYAFCSRAMLLSALPIHPGAAVGLPARILLALVMSQNSMRRIFDWTHDTQHASPDSQIAAKDAIYTSDSPTIPRHRSSPRWIWVAAITLGVLVSGGFIGTLIGLDLNRPVTPPNITFEITDENGAKNPGSLQNQRLLRHITQRLSSSHNTYGTVEEQFGDSFNIRVNRRYFGMADSIARRLSLRGELTIGVLASLERDGQLIEHATRDMSDEEHELNDQVGVWVNVGNPKLIENLKRTENVSIRRNQLTNKWQVLFLKTEATITNEAVEEVGQFGTYVSLEFDRKRFDEFSQQLTERKSKKDPPFAALIDNQLWFLIRHKDLESKLRLKGDLYHRCVEDLTAVLKFGPLSEGRVRTNFGFHWR